MTTSRRLFLCYVTAAAVSSQKEVTWFEVRALEPALP